MAYTVIDDWRGGLDRRRLPSVANPTTLWSLTNAHINEGGEIEKRKAFVDYANAAGTIGLASANGLLHVFGSGGSPLPGGSPLTYQQLDPGASVTVTAILDVDLFDGKLFVIALGSDNNVYYFYDGAKVSGAAGRRCKTFGSKVYTVADKDVKFCATNDPTDWAGTGSGTINLSTEDADSLALEGLEIYYGQLAFLSPTTTQFWSVRSDPLQNTQTQVLRAAGTRAGKSTRQYGNGDVLYLDATGIRSLRARDENNSASVADIGSPIDPLLRAILLSDAATFAAAQSAVEPGTGRYWLALANQVFVLSHFPGPKVTAWSKYVPEQGVADITGHGFGVAIRGTDDRIYLYGGEDYNTFDSCPVTAVTPFLAGGKPGTTKVYSALDVAGDNVWKVETNLVPGPKDSLDTEANWDTLGVFDGTTYAMDQMGFNGRSTHAAFRLTCTRPGEARMANLTFHYDEIDG